MKKTVTLVIAISVACTMLPNTVSAETEEDDKRDVNVSDSTISDKKDTGQNLQFGMLY